MPQKVYQLLNTAKEKAEESALALVVWWSVTSSIIVVSCIGILALFN